MSYRKYRNTKTVVDGVVIDSRKEARRLQDLRLLERAGVISELTMQPRFKIEIGGVPIRYVDTGRQVSYVGDFSYRDHTTGEVVIEDVKGCKTRVYQLKKAMMAAMGIIIREI